MTAADYLDGITKSNFFGLSSMEEVIKQKIPRARTGRHRVVRDRRYI
jgi:hypothetical protein